MTTRTLLTRLEHRFLWGKDYSGHLARPAVDAVRLAVLVARDFVDGGLTLRAMSLVYTTLLSLVPLLAFSFSILKGFGVHYELEPLLSGYLAPLGVEKSKEIVDSIVGFVDNMNVRVLGAVGLGLLVYTVVSLMQKVEGAFNEVWRVKSERSFAERFATFVSALTVGPLLVFSALAITGTVMNNAVMEYVRSMPGAGWVIQVLAALVPYALVIVAFTFLYIFVPNTRVKLRHALVGGVVAGLLWESVGYVFASFAAGASNYQAIYATFASAVLFMIWIYLSWLILLIGASIAFYRQHPGFVRTGSREIHLTSAEVVRCALLLIARVGRRFYDGGSPPTLEQLAVSVGMPGHALEGVLIALETQRILAHTDGDPPGYVPAVPFERTTVAGVLERLNEHRADGGYPVKLPEDPRVDEIIGKSLCAVREATERITLRDLSVDAPADAR